MNDDIEKINNEYDAHIQEKNKSDISPGLNINHQVQGEEEKKREKLRELSEALGIDEHRKEIDKLNSSVTYIADELTKTNSAINTIAQALSTGQAPPSVSTPQSTGMDIEKLEVVGNLLEKVMGMYGQYKQMGQPQGPAPLIDQSIINQKMQQTFFDNLETGESINNFIKDSLKKTVTKKVINSSLSEIGKANNEVNHGP